MGHLPKTPHASEYQNTYYGEKTSDYGHWERERTGTRNGSNLSSAPVYQMNWVEDNRQMSAAPQEQPEEPPKNLDDYTDKGKDEDHLAAEDDYKDNFKDGNPSAATSAADSYQSAFDRAAAAGKDMTPNDYLTTLAGNKKMGVNRFIGYLGDKNRLANEEQNYASGNFMDQAKYLDFKGPPTLNDPSEAYDKYKNDIDSIG